MLTRTLSIGLALITSAASASAASTLTERLQAERMTVVRVDQATGRFLCAEHRRWSAVLKADLRDVHAGDVVVVERGSGKPARITVVRSAADELGSPE